MLNTIAVENYRSLQDIVIDLAELTVVTGPNGSGKSNIYRALGLIHSIVQDGALTSLAQEGGLRNALYAGARTSKRVSLRLGISVDELNYAIDLGLPQLGPFPRDPEVKSETVWHGAAPRPSAILAQRTGQHVQLTDIDGVKAATGWNPRAEESMLATLTDPTLSPELYALREVARSWRFYDNLRVDRAAPARSAYPATFSPVLNADGSNFAAALATVLHLGDYDSFHRAVENAFDGARASVVEDDRGIAHVQLENGLRRPLDVTELSDGTLRFLLLATILHSPRPPKLLVLNEPEVSLHPSLLSEVARMIVAASANTQVIVVTHSEALSRYLVPNFEQSTPGRAQVSLSGAIPTELVDRPDFASQSWIWPPERR